MFNASKTPPLVDSNPRSNIIDVTFQSLQAALAGYLEVLTSDQLKDSLRLRLDKFQECLDPFGKPSKESRDRVESGSVTLPDGVVIKVEDEDKLCVWAISKRFNLDEVDALILLRSFLFNEGLPAFVSSANETTGIVDELVEAITPFYFEERLSILRIFIPLLRGQENSTHPLHELATEFLPKMILDSKKFPSSLLAQFVAKTKLQLPPTITSSPRYASKWARQLVKEQLCALEVLFWSMWSDAACTGPLVVEIYKAIAETDLGTRQSLSSLLLDEEGTQLLRDIENLLILIAIEVLNIEKIIEDGAIELSENISDPLFLTSSPEHLLELHTLVKTFADNRYAPVILSWACVLHRLTILALNPDVEIPARYQKFLEVTIPHADPMTRFSKPPDPVFQSLAATLLRPEVGLLRSLCTTLTTSPLFVTSAAWSTGSAITEPNAIAFRSVIKGLLIALTELLRVEYLPDFDSFVKLWETVFGFGESHSVAALCRQFWDMDWRTGVSRRSLFDVSRTRFPIHFRPLVRLLRAMSGSGTLGLESSVPLSRMEADDFSTEQDRKMSTSYVYHYFLKLPTFTQAIPQSGPLGFRSLYEVGASRSDGLSYTNTRAIRLPGGSVLPPGSQGRLLSSPGGDGGPLVISWDHQHSGWKLILEVMTDYVHRRRGIVAGVRRSPDSTSTLRPSRRTDQPISLALEDIGMEVDIVGEEELITEILDLLYAILRDNDALSQQFIQGLDEGGTIVSHAGGGSPPDFVQLTISILEDALARSNPGIISMTSSSTRLITSAINILSAVLRVAPDRVWPFLRSDPLLFGSQNQRGLTPILFTVERVSGHYSMTLALLDLVKGLFNETIASVLMLTKQFLLVKEEVLLRAVKFIHAEVWVEHTGWKYARLGDRFEIGRRITDLYGDILRNWSSSSDSNGDASPSQDATPVFSALASFVTDAFLYRATTAAIAPLISSINAAKGILTTLHRGRRISEARGLVRLLQSHLRLCRIVLTYKRMSSVNAKLCLLEQALCSGVAGGATSLAARRSKVDPVDTIASFVKDRGLGVVVPLEATELLSSLCLSLAMTQASPISIVSHLSNAEAVAAEFIRIVRHPFDNLALRNAVWNFISLAVDTQPAFATLFVSGSFRIPSMKNKAKGAITEPSSENNTPNSTDSVNPSTHSAVEAACETLSAWKELWTTNPRLLASALGFLEVVWHHALEHTSVLDSTRTDPQFWTYLSSIIKEEPGLTPEWKVTSFVDYENQVHSNLHEAVSNYAYKCVAKAHALMVLALDLNVTPRSKSVSSPSTSVPPPSNLVSVKTLLDFIQDSDLEAHLSEALNTYDPKLQDTLRQEILTLFPTLNLDSLRAYGQALDREFGDDYLFPVQLAQDRVAAFVAQGDLQAQDLQLQLYNINLNWSLADAQIARTKAWRRLLQASTPVLQENMGARKALFAVCVPLSKIIASESRPGEVMTEVHGERLRMLLSLLEVAWKAPLAAPDETTQFMSLLQQIHDIILSPTFRPLDSLRSKSQARFHRPLLQIAFFCARKSRILGTQAKALRADQRVMINSFISASLGFAIDALRDCLDVAQSSADVDIDKDMELLVAVFDQCTRCEIHSSPSLWLAKCQEADLIRASLDVLVKIDIIGVPSDRRYPLYARHILNLHLALASLPSSAERLANEGVVAAYSNNSLTAGLSSGSVDVTYPDIPGEHNPAHQAWCMILSVIEGLIVNVESAHFIEGEMVGFVQLYGAQLTRALGWTVGQPLNLSFLNELERTVGIFYTMSIQSDSRSARAAGMLRAFTERALVLLQHLNYALSHPNHLASLFEAINPEERTNLEREARRLSIESAQELLDSSKRPFLASLVQRLLAITRDITSTLAIASGADQILVSDPSDWPLETTQVLPHAKVALGEPASLGTLIELGNGMADLLRHLLTQPRQTTSLSGLSIPSFDPKICIPTLRQTLEAVLTYASTQIVLWLYQTGSDQVGPSATLEFDDGGFMDIDETHLSTSRDYKAKRRSSVNADRLRRGLTGELATDLHQLLMKAKAVIDRCEGGGEDMMTILKNFIEQKLQ